MKKYHIYGLLILSFVVVASVDLYNGYIKKQPKKEPKKVIVNTPHVTVRQMETVADLESRGYTTTGYYNIAIGYQAGMQLQYPPDTPIVKLTKKKSNKKGFNSIYDTSGYLNLANKYDNYPIGMSTNLDTITGTDSYSLGGFDSLNRLMINDSSFTRSLLMIEPLKTGHNNICIGKEAGRDLIYESYCVIVGSGDKAINAKGKDMIWEVDWNEPGLIKYPKVKKALEDYYNNVIKEGKDSKELRKMLSENVIMIFQLNYTGL